MNTLNSVHLDNTKAQFLEVVNLLKSGENVTTLWLPGAGRTRFGMSLQDQFTEIYPEIDQGNIVFIYLDLGLETAFLERQLLEALAGYSDAPTIKSKIQALISAGQEIVFVLDNFSVQNPGLANYVMSLKNIAVSEIRILALMTDCAFEQAQVNVKNYPYLPFLFHNIITLPLPSIEEAKLWLRQLEKQFEVKLTDDDIEKIIHYCGTLPRLLKNYVRGLKRNHDHKQVVTSTEFNYIVQYLWQEFSPEEQNAIRSAYLTGKVSDEKVAKFFYSTGLITPAGKVLGQWPELVVRSPEDLQIKLEGDKLLWQGIELSSLLSTQEYGILKLLISSQDKLVTRDDIATVMWGAKAADKYSDWAIDKQISRLRKKLETFGIGNEAIVTLKRRGFHFKMTKV